jgi:L-cystine uptake protein TcyP (sodium:dicarboxylate symporter family)
VDLYGWIVWAHVVTVILAFAAHGVSAFAMFRIQRERDRARLAAILDLSKSSLAIAGIALIAATILGVVAAVVGDHFQKVWPWVAIGVLVVAFGSMTPLAAVPMNKVRAALALGVPGDLTGATAGAGGSDEELATALAGIRPMLPTAIGVAGILILSWLMRARPF